MLEVVQKLEHQLDTDMTSMSNIFSTG